MTTKFYKNKSVLMNIYFPVDAFVSDSNFSVDTWFHISKFINPEDVGSFALICRSTAYITSTSEFWQNLYNRYVVKKIKDQNCSEYPPEHLWPDQIFNERKGIRAKVIQSLFYTYNLFVKRLAVKSIIVYDCFEHDKRDKLMSQFEKMHMKCMKILKSSPIAVGARPRLRPTLFDFFRDFPSNFQEYVPQYFLYYFKKVENLSDNNKSETDENLLGNIHQSEEIYLNNDEDILVLYIKILKNKFHIEGPALTEFHLKSARVRETKLSKYSFVTLEFEDIEKCALQRHTFEHVVELRVFNWFEFNQNILHQHQWRKIHN